MSFRIRQSKPQFLQRAGYAMKCALVDIVSPNESVRRINLIHLLFLIISILYYLMSLYQTVCRMSLIVFIIFVLPMHGSIKTVFLFIVNCLHVAYLM